MTVFMPLWDYVKLSACAPYPDATPSTILRKLPGGQVYACVCVCAVRLYCATVHAYVRRAKNGKCQFEYCEVDYDIGGTKTFDSYIYSGPVLVLTTTTTTRTTTTGTSPHVVRTTETHRVANTQYV